MLMDGPKGQANSSWQDSATISRMQDLACVIIGYNEEGRVGKCIDSVRAALPGDRRYDIVYVDSRSSDNSLEEALNHGARCFVLGENMPRTANSARRVGIEVTSSDYILFVDGDCMVAPGWVPLALELLQRSPELGAIGGCYNTVSPGEEKPPVKVRSLGKLRAASYVPGAAALYRREAVVRAGGWNPHVPRNEEIDLAMRMRHVAGFSVLYSQECLSETRAAANYPLRNTLRMIRNGYLMGFAVVLKNALAGGYAREYIPTIVLPLALGALVPIALAVSLVTRTFLHLTFAGLLCLLIYAIVRGRVIRPAIAFLLLTISGLVCFVHLLVGKAKPPDSCALSFSSVSPEQAKETEGRAVMFPAPMSSE